MSPPMMLLTGAHTDRLGGREQGMANSRQVLLPDHDRIASMSDARMSFVSGE